MRVDRRLQKVQDLPDALNYGYVFLSDNAGQTGLMSAAGRINAVRTELASITSNVAVVDLGSEEPAAQITKNGQIYIFPKEEELTSALPGEEVAPDPRAANQNATEAVSSGMMQTALSQAWGFEAETSVSYPIGRANPTAMRESLWHSYSLRSDLGAPAGFCRAVFSPDGEDILRGIVAQFRFDDAALVVAQQSATKIVMEEIEIFAGKRDRPEEIRALLAQREIDAKAQLTLLRADEYGAVNVQELHAALQEQLRKVADQHGIEHVFDTPEKLRAGLHKILALRPAQLKNAISETIARHIASEAVEPLPATHQSIDPLEPARLNVYGIFPDDLNTWELPFAKYLDNDLTGTVLWWHRNPVHKPWSVSMPLPGQNDFYPDFVVGVNGRKRGHGILLMETKRDINDEKRNALVKAQAIHPEYGKVMMLYWEDGRQWRVVEYDPATDKNLLDRALRTELMTVY